MKVYVKGTGTSLDLNRRDYVAQGGEAVIYARRGVAYRIYHNPATMPPVGKLTELAEIKDPRVINPRDILVDVTGKPIGFTMRFVDRAIALCAMFPKAFREREGITHAQVADLVEHFRSLVANVHAAHVLIVDLNEMNVLVDAAYKDVFAIDTTSYQTPHYPATAIMDSIRDPQDKTFSELTDWYSFAIVTFQAFVGIHPFKGKYKGGDAGLRGKLPMDADDDGFAPTRRRMAANVSIFHSEVSVPAATYPFDVIPIPYRRWYEDLFVKGKRCPPPSAMGVIVLSAAPVPAVGGATALDIREMRQYAGIIRYVWSDGKSLIVATDKGLAVDGRNVATPADMKVTACGFTPLGGRVVVAGLNGRRVVLFNATDGTPVSFDANAEEVRSYDGRIYFRTADGVYEVRLFGTGSAVIATSVQVSQTTEHSSRLWPGVVTQDLLGSLYVSLLTATGTARQIRIPELDAYQIQEAKFDGGVLMVTGIRRGARHTAFADRLVFRFGPEGDDTYDVRTIANITPTGLNFVTLDTGVTVCLTEEDRLEIFSAQKGSVAIKTIEEKTLGADMTLAKMGGTVLFTRGDRVYWMKTR